MQSDFLWRGFRAADEYPGIANEVFAECGEVRLLRKRALLKRRDEVALEEVCAGGERDGVALGGEEDG